MKFEGVVWKTGTSCVVTVPASYINNRLLECGKKYEFEAKETGVE